MSSGAATCQGRPRVGLGTAPRFDQDDAGCTRNKDVTQSVSAVATELKDRLSDISDTTVSGTQLHNLRIHSPNHRDPGRCRSEGSGQCVAMLPTGHSTRRTALGTARPPTSESEPPWSPTRHPQCRNSRSSRLKFHRQPYLAALGRLNMPLNDRRPVAHGECREREHSTGIRAGPLRSQPREVTRSSKARSHRSCGHERRKESVEFRRDLSQAIRRPVHRER
jgi:hypothetical protein